MRRKGQQAENDKTERVTGLGRRTREEIAKWNQMTALRHQTSPASLRGVICDGQALISFAGSSCCVRLIASQAPQLKLCITPGISQLWWGKRWAVKRFRRHKDKRPRIIFVDSNPVILTSRIALNPFCVKLSLVIKFSGWKHIHGRNLRTELPPTKSFFFWRNQSRHTTLCLRIMYQRIKLFAKRPAIQKICTGQIFFEKLNKWSWPCWQQPKLSF